MSKSVNYFRIKLRGLEHEISGQKQLLNIFQMLRHADHDHPLIALNVGVPDSDLPNAVSMDASNHYFAIIGSIQFG
jgi:hypothetical protein